LWYERAGGGFPVVFVHSGLMDARIWEPQFEAFAEQHEVVRYDRRGFGRSDAPTGPFSDLRDLHDRLDELRAAALLIVGEEDIAEVGEIADLVAAQVPGASKRVVAETDQLVNVGMPERFNRLALDFLAFAG
jgi:pimeloyl-ACP methyl ester carboxylesterase